MTTACDFRIMVPGAEIQFVQVRATTFFCKKNDIAWPQRWHWNWGKWGMEHKKQEQSACYVCLLIGVSNFFSNKGGDNRLLCYSCLSQCNLHNCVRAHLLMMATMLEVFSVMAFTAPATLVTTCNTCEEYFSLLHFSLNK